MRTGSMVLAAVLVLGGLSATAQTFGGCWSSSGWNPVRAEGLSELIGDINVNCYGPLPPQIDVKVRLNTNITNNKDYLEFGSTDSILWASEGCSYYPCPAPLIRYGRLVADNELRWDPIALTAPATAYLNVRLVNIRAAAFEASPVMATVSVSPTGSSETLFTAQFQIASPQPALNVSLQPPGVESLRIRVQEGYQNAFNPLGSPIDPNYPYFPGGQEDGYLTPGSGKNDGGATQGTRLLIRLQQAPRGARVLVPYLLQPTPELELRRVLHADQNGAGGCYYQFCVEPPPAGTLGPADSYGTDAVAVYEVIRSSSYLVEYADIPVAICQGQATGCRVLAGTPALRGLLVRVSLAPVSTVDRADSNAPRPRFVDNQIPIDVVRWPR